MIFITQLIFVKEGHEDTFLEFERHAIPLMAEYGGKVIYRLRPSIENFIDANEEELPFEIHLISFENDANLSAFMQDKRRQNYMHFKNQSVSAVILLKGEKM